MSRRTVVALLLAGLAFAPLPAAAQGEAGTPAARDRGARTADTPAELPPPVTSRHRLDLPGGPLAFTATAGAVRLHEDGGTALADVVMTSYRLDDADPATRPVTFVVNGGPGAASAWLQLGAVGPWRVDLAEAAAPPSAPPRLVDNAETWLAFTDLVFVDPIGTGYSRPIATGEDVRRRFYGVDGDIDMLSASIRRWVEDNRRELSPKFFLGESYGGFRGPLVARRLAQDHGIGLAGLVLVSPVLDFRMRDGGNPLAEAARLPSMVAAARRLSPGLGPADLADVERYAAGDYLTDIVKGPRDAAARERIVAAVARLTGLEPDLVRRNGGRLSTGTFVANIARSSNRIASPYDATALGLDPDPYSERHGAFDPVLEALKAPLTAAARELYAARLGWAPKRRYELLASGVNRSWDWGRSTSPPESAGALQEMLAADRRFRTLVVHGDADLVTPYFASKLVMNQIAVPDVGTRLRLATYPGGHMFYFDPASRAAFRDAGRALLIGSTD